MRSNKVLKNLSVSDVICDKNTENNGLKLKTPAISWDALLRKLDVVWRVQCVLEI